MNAIGEKSMLVLTGLILGLIITWLIATDKNVPGTPAYIPNGAGIPAIPANHAS
ncbi:hypothetical protein [Methylomagnum sp.]